MARAHRRVATELETRLESRSHPELAADLERSLATLASVALLMPSG